MHQKGCPLTLILVTCIIWAMLMASGCTETGETIFSPTTGNRSCETAGYHQCNGSTLLLLEAERQFARMNTSQYAYTTAVDEENGTYRYDCSGFVGYALYRADSCAFNSIPDERPDTGSFYSHIIRSVTEPGSSGWMRVLSPRELLPGDIIVWPRDLYGDGNAGHIMIVADNPAENPDRAGEILVRVIDSTTSRHANDTRSPGEDGLGKGTIGIMTNESGMPVGYFWRGGESPTLRETDMAFARII